MIHNFLNTNHRELMHQYLDYLGFVATMVILTITLGIFFYKISASQRELVKMVSKSLKIQTNNNEKDHLFQLQIHNDIKGFKEDNNRQRGICTNHNDAMGEVLLNQKNAITSQAYMEDSFREFKQVIVNNTEVLNELLIIIRERK